MKCVKEAAAGDDGRWSASACEAHATDMRSRQYCMMPYVEAAIVNTIRTVPEAAHLKIKAQIDTGSLNRLNQLGVPTTISSRTHRRNRKELGCSRLLTCSSGPARFCRLAPRAAPRTP